MLVDTVAAQLVKVRTTRVTLISHILAADADPTALSLASSLSIYHALPVFGAEMTGARSAAEIDAI